MFEDALKTPWARIYALTAAERTPHTNRQLAYFLVFVAGAVNAGGFVAVAQYTSHISGIVSSIASHLALGSLIVTLQGLVALLSFAAGAGTTAVVVNLARRTHLASLYALPRIALSLQQYVASCARKAQSRIGLAPACIAAPMISSSSRDDVSHELRSDSTRR